MKGCICTVVHNILYLNKIGKSRSFSILDCTRKGDFMKRYKEIKKKILTYLAVFFMIISNLSMPQTIKAAKPEVKLAKKNSLQLSGNR